MDNEEAEMPITPAGYPLAWIMSADDVIWPDCSDALLHENTWGRVIIADREAMLVRYWVLGEFPYTRQNVAARIRRHIKTRTDDMIGAIY